MKHLALDYHFVRGQVANHQLRVHHIPSSSQLADLLTKPLSTTKHRFFTTKIGVADCSTILRGPVREQLSSQPQHEA
ncbi:hypothetical protein L6164_028636 [Bauhinia variegata]|uniref:Uncharacterized protein n=1 Tax=Bauhinia variegata TaxID=167791 RepID=A0ACB9L7E2_BAUVA|nr:hypothetical protein L6164_028636 [Bauhinia variegata]